VNSPKDEFFDAVASLKPGLTEFSHLLDQSGGEQKLVHPLRFNMHIHQKPLLLRVLLGALEGGIDVLLTVVTMK
jgi:hypothetical protein